MESKNKYFENLDGLRFLCFLFVFTVHSLHPNNANIQSNIFFKIIVNGLFGNGWLAVNFFFVLSGFLITHLLIVERSKGKINIPHFWFKRVIRIWPLYYACVLFGFVLFPYLKAFFGQQVHEHADLKLYLLFLGNFDILKNGWPDSTELGVLWSISIEEQFYLVWPILLYIFPVKKYWMVFSLIIIISLIFRGYNDDPLIYHYHTLSCISDMAIGGLGAWLVTQFTSVKNIITQLNKYYIIFIYIIFSFLFIFREQILTQIYFVRVFERLIISVFMLLIILEQNYSVNSFYKMKNFKAISKLGLTTYGMYMLHIIAFLIVMTLLTLLHLNENVFFLIIAGPILGLILTIYMSKLSYNVFEQRFLKLRKYIKN